MPKEKKFFDSWRAWLATLGWFVLFVSTAVAARKVQNFVSNDPQFILSPETRDTISIAGVVHASRSRIARVFSPDLGNSIYLMPLAERRRRLLAIDWVQDAAVSRIWPNHVLVR